MCDDPPGRRQGPCAGAIDGKRWRVLARAWLPLAAALGLAISPCSAQQMHGASKAFAAWSAACQPDGYCTASSSAAGGEIFRIGRPAMKTYWELSLASRAGSPQAAAGLTATIGNTSWQFLPPGEIGAFGADGQWYLLGANAQGLLDRLMSASSLSITYAGAPSVQPATEFSLDGLTAALIWIDTVQHRIGSERVAGPPPAGRGEPGPDLPDAVVAMHAAGKDCLAPDALAGAPQSVTARLDGVHTLYLVPCAAGALNVSYRAYVGMDGTFDPIYFATYDDNLGWGGTPYLVNPVVDAATATLTMFRKASDMGDCGSLAEWHWTGDGFRLMRFRFKASCDGAGVGDFPLVYAADPDELSRQLPQ